MVDVAIMFWTCLTKTMVRMAKNVPYVEGQI